MPQYASKGAAGFDLRCLLDNNQIELKPGEVVKLSTGLAMEIPKDYVGLIFPRSGLSTRNGIILANIVGVIDSDYRGEVILAVKNSSSENQIISNNERIAQMVIMSAPVVDLIEVNNISDTERGDGGFGHSGKH